MTYHFRSLDDDSRLPAGTTRLDDTPTPRAQATLNAGAYGVYMAAFRGSLIRLFGAPFWSTQGIDEGYEYIIEATDTNGHSWALTASGGSSGPYIGGDCADRSIYPAAEALLQLIETTTPADFTVTVYDDDTNNTISYGCSNGQCYWHERRGKHP